MNKISHLLLMVLAMLVLVGKACGQIAVSDDITSLNTTDVFGSSSTVNVPGAGTPTYASGTTYSITYQSDVTSISSFSTASTTYVPITYSGTITTTLDRATDAAPDNNTVYNRTISQAGTSITVAGPLPTSEQATFNANNLNVGTDNLFANQGDGNGNNNNVERLDVVFNNGLTANNALAFVVMERGVSSAHDSFQIAAITGIDINGNPTSYGSLLAFGAGSTYGAYGSTALSPYDGTTNWLVSRNAEPGAPTSPSTNVGAQSVGGVTVAVTGSTASNGLGIADGTTIYGYSLFASDVTGSGSQLLDYTNSAFFPQATDATAGGIDLIAYTGVAFTAVPEPRAYGLLPILALGLIWIGRLLRRKPVLSTANL